MYSGRCCKKNAGSSYVGEEEKRTIFQEWVDSWLDEHSNWTKGKEKEKSTWRNIFSTLPFREVRIWEQSDEK